MFCMCESVAASNVVRSELVFAASGKRLLQIFENSNFSSHFSRSSGFLVFGFWPRGDGAEGFLCVVGKGKTLPQCACVCFLGVVHFLFKLW